ncbi:hypothetical protein C4D60_Mb01t02740 [Musa balbisiana]|uniref:Uncharacterized protein n=1 Tax=Musa balbisiana TaxID=52838 RepID=A0A4S8JJE1_MUSBA|nr:hypothetical protein C4D60_Mb01t02740 [Musa balbisiana]
MYLWDICSAHRPRKKQTNLAKFHPMAFSMQQGGDKDAVMRRRQGQGTGVAAGVLCNQTSHVLRAHCISPLFCWLVEVIAPGACRPTVHTRLNLNHSSPGPGNEPPPPAT